MSADPPSRAQRRRDTEHRLTHDKDVWVASASADGTPYQAWREVNEMPDRELMRDGRWLVRRLGPARRVTEGPKGPKVSTGRSGVDTLVLAPSATRAGVSRTGVAPPRPTPPIR